MVMIHYYSQRLAADIDSACFEAALACTDQCPVTAIGIFEVVDHKWKLQRQSLAILEAVGRMRIHSMTFDRRLVYLWHGTSPKEN